MPGNHLMTQLLGARDEHLDTIEDAFPAALVTARGNEITITGDEAALVGQVVEELVVMVERGHLLDRAAVLRVIDMVQADERPSEVLTSEIARRSRGGAVKPKTLGQKRYVDAIASNIITFGVGPAGTGKSWLAVAMAVQSLQRREVDRIVLTRPAVEAGERLGFLPGDLMAKVDPYLRPLYDALYDMVEPEGGAEAARTRPGGGRSARLHARPHPEPQLHHPRRGAEHEPRADEDVPHPDRLRLEGGRDR